MNLRCHAPTTAAVVAHVMRANVFAILGSEVWTVLKEGILRLNCLVPVARKTALVMELVIMVSVYVT